MSKIKEIPEVSIWQGLYGALKTKKPKEINEVLRLQKIYGNIFGVDMPFISNSYIITGADEIAHVYKSYNIYIKKYRYDLLMRAIFGDGIIMSSGAKYDDRKTNMLPSFKKSAMEKYIAIMNDSINIYINKIRHSISNKPIVDVQHYIQGACLDIAAKSFFNTDLREEIEDIDNIVEYCNAAFTSALQTLLRYPKSVFLSYRLRNIMKKRFIHSGNNFSEDNRDCFLHSLSNYNGNPDYQYYTNKEKVDEMITMLLAGHETSAALITYALYLLYANKPYLELVLEEISRLTTEDISSADLKSCTYIKMLVHETLRLNPSIWSVRRYTATDDNICGYNIPAKSQVFCNLFALHRNPAYWDNPHDFNPFRFSIENKSNIYPNSYMPFGTGFRGCVAANFSSIEVQIIIIRLLQSFEFSLVPGYKLEMVAKLSLRMKNNLMLYCRVI